MTVFRIYTDDDKYVGFFLSHEEKLAAMYVEVYGGYYRKVEA